MSKTSVALAASAVTLGAVDLSMTLIGIAVRDWRWSDALATLSSLMAAAALILVSVCFRDHATQRKVNITLGLLAATATLFVVFPRNSAAF